MQNRKNARWVRYTLVAAVLAGLGLMALWPNPMKVEAAQASVGTVREVLDAQGVTRLREPYLVSAPISGQLRRIVLQPGDQVRAGDTLATIDPATSTTLDARSRSQADAQLSSAQASRMAAQSGLEAAQSSFAQASADVRRMVPLAEQGMVSASALEQARTTLRQAELAVQTARHQVAMTDAQVRSAQAQLSPARLASPGSIGLSVPSPVDGVILRRHVESAGVVQMGAPLLELGDPSALEVAVDVLSADAVRLHPGTAVELLRTGTGNALKGQIRRVEPGAFTKVSALGVEEQRVWVVIDLTSPPAEWSGLGDGYRVQARFVLSQADQTVRVPTSAVFRHGEGKAVFLITDKRAHLTPVTTAQTGEGMVAISDGIVSGNTVVVHPPAELTDDMRVTVP